MSDHDPTVVRSLAATDPDALVTDDMFGAMAANRVGVPLYVLKHDMPGLYDDVVERTGAGFHTTFQLSAAREFYYPVVWPASGADPGRATRIPPVALDGHPPVRDEADVVVVPSHYSDLDRVADHLRRQGYDVLNVADADWDAVPSLLPYIRGADAVVCSGYSTIMDAAVAGTPCVVHPATDEQDAVADWLERFDVTGFAVAPEPIDVLDAVAHPPDPPSFENGATYIAEQVLGDLRDPDPYATDDAGGDATEGASPGSDEEMHVVTGGSRLDALGTIPTVAAAGLIATGSVLSPFRIGRGVTSRVRRVLAAVAAGVVRGVRAGRTAAGVAGDVAVDRVGGGVAALLARVPRSTPSAPSVAVPSRVRTTAADESDEADALEEPAALEASDSPDVTAHDDEGGAGRVAGAVRTAAAPVARAASGVGRGARRVGGATTSALSTAADGCGNALDRCRTAAASRLGGR